MSRSVVARRRIGLRSAGMSMTPEEFDALPPSVFDRRFRYEIIRGMLIVSPTPRAAERGPNEYLGFLLLGYQETHPQGSVLDATLPEHTVPTTENRRRCDRAIWAGLGHLPDEEKDIPSIVVEFVSASRKDHRRDYEEKRDEYLAAGIREYWIIDRFHRIMTVHRNSPEGHASRVIDEASSYQTDLLPGFDLPIARLLAKADDWSRKRRRRPPVRGAE